MSGAIASMLLTVSSSVSPLTTLDVETARLSVSALSRFSAISNDVRVRVLGSKKRLTMVRPRSAGTFLIARSPTSPHRVGGVEDEDDLLGGEIADPEQVAAAQAGELAGALMRSSSSITSSRPSIR